MRTIILLLLGVMMLGCTSTEAAQNETVGGNASDGNMSEQPSVGLNVTSSELEQNDGESRCWVRFNDDVYDITDFMPNHPGGKEALIGHCGSTNQSFTDAFMNQHGSEFIPKLENNTDFIGMFIG